MDLHPTEHRQRETRLAATLVFTIVVNPQQARLVRWVILLLATQGITFVISDWELRHPNSLLLIVCYGEYFSSFNTMENETVEVPGRWVAVLIR